MTPPRGARVRAGAQALQVRARGFGVPGAGAEPGAGCRSRGSDARPRVRDAGLRNAQGPGCKVPLGRALVSRAEGTRATCGPPDAVSLGASPAREERAGGSRPLWSHSLNGACVLMRRRPEATSFMFQVSVSLQAAGPARPEAPTPSNLWFRAAVGQPCSPATPRKVKDLQSIQPGVLA